MPKPRRPRIEVNPAPQPPIITVNGTRIEAEREPADPITSTLDKLYGEADAFTQQITSSTGGKVYTASTFEGTKSAFASVAEELRNQYVLGFYPSIKKDNRYRKLKVEVSRKEVLVRSRIGYRLSD
jgi:hypothetical protein